ncbi:unnamed protein product [Rotaria magnacalcarata]|uniref:Ig-like domain-containing protein n=3 Tax=Rotaria magnacalcarata TaxID=392030 RepID=A0A819EQD0_9BILA|nr:unnamed protein product [Rotaria magnacalcarata]CAF2100574.1 unnamed protein product [Rotaria magnacalcarata]CAF3803419.1 unnamed protein product [Rotaria magnacalcarata]CAF3853259.1 unnamed protein product [Rotaria magnacalcarata]
MHCLTLLLFIGTIYVSSSRSEIQRTIDDDDEDLFGSLVAFDITIENYTVPVSGKCILTCYIAEVRSFKVLWQKIDRINQGGNQTFDEQQEQLTLIAFDGTVYSNKDHYRLESDYVGSYNLIIDRVNEDDQGEYQCQINTEPRKTKRIFLTVQVPPRIVDFRPNPPLISIRSGISLTLLCRAEGTPLPHIRWRIRDIDMNRIDSLPPENSNIWFISAVTTNFPHTVECIADNGVLPASNRIFTISVEIPPIVMINNDLIQSQLYQNVTLDCSILSRPLARIYWEKNGQIIDDSKMTSTQINQTLSINQLKVQINDDDDFGKYNCIAENIHGRKEAFVYLLKESVVVTTLTTKKYQRYSKNSSLRFSSSRKVLRSTTLPTKDFYIEREIHITSSSYRLSTHHRLKNLLFISLLLCRLRRTDR